MLENIIARRYARAFWEIARDKGKEEGFSKALKALAQALGSKELVHFWKSPLFEVGEKLTVLEKALKPLHLPKEVANFARLLITRKRFSLIQEIEQEFERTYDQEAGRARALVYSPYPLLRRQARELEKSLSQITGKKISIDAKIDETLLGGVVIRIENIVLDASVKGRLRRFAESLG